MLYDKRTRTLIETNVTGEVPEARFVELASLKGASLKEGPVEKVALVFAMPGHAEQNVALCKRFGIECRGFGEDGMEKVLFEGPRVSYSDEKPDGPLVPVLREASWPHVETAAHRRLLRGPLDQGPWVTYGWDTPKTIVRMSADALGDRSIDDVEREACANLLARRDKIRWQMIEGHTVWLTEEYGSEMILVPEIMREVASRLRARMIAVGVHSEHGFFATSAEDPKQVGVLIQWTRLEFDKSQKRRVSPIPFIVDDRGELIGLVAATPASSPATSDAGEELSAKPWWKFW